MNKLRLRAYLLTSLVVVLAKSGLAMFEDPLPKYIMPIFVSMENIASEHPKISEFSGDTTFEERNLRVTVTNIPGKTELRFFAIDADAYLDKMEFSSAIFGVEESGGLLHFYLNSPRYPERISLVLIRDIQRLTNEQLETLGDIAQRLFKKMNVGKTPKAKLYLTENRAFETMPADIKSALEPYVKVVTPKIPHRHRRMAENFDNQKAK